MANNTAQETPNVSKDNQEDWRICLAVGCCDSTDMVDTKQNHKKVQINETFIVKFLLQNHRS